MMMLSNLSYVYWT